MPIPRVFGNEAELINLLRQHKAELKKWFAPKPDELERILHRSIGPNTYRAFRNTVERPSNVFRDWAQGYFGSKSRQATIGRIKTQEAYDDWHEKMCRRLRRRWRDRMEEEMGFGPSTKLPNLLMKGYVRWSGVTPEQRRRLIPFLHVPLDIYSIVGLRDCLPHRALPKLPTMGFVEDEFTYWCLQDKIRQIARKAGIPPIYYDVLAWNLSH